MKPFNKLKRNLTLSLVLIILIPIVAISVIAYKNIYYQRYTYARERYLEQQEIYLSLTENLFDEKLALNDMQVFSMVPISDEMLITKVLQQFRDAEPEVESILLYRLKDDVFYTVGDLDSEKTQLLNLATSTEKFIFEHDKVYIISRSKNNILLKSYPIEIAFNNLMQDQAQKELYYNDRLIFSTGMKESVEDQSLWTVLTSREAYFKLRVIYTLENFMVSYREIMRSTILLILMACLMIIGWIKFAVSRQFKIFETLLESINRLLKGDYSIRIKENGSAEVREIIRAFNQMGSQIEARITEHAFHLNEMIEQSNQLNETSRLLNQSIIEAEKNKEELTLIKEKNEILINKFDQLLIRFDESGFITYMNKYGMEKLGIDDCANLSMHNVIKYRYDLESYSDLVAFLNKYEVNQIQLEFMNFKTHYSDTLLVSNKHVMLSDGHKEVQLIGKELSMAYVVEKNLKKTKIEYEILDDINFDNLKFDQIEKYFEKITQNLYQLLDPVEVSIIHIEDGRIQTMKYSSKIEAYRKLEGKGIADSIFEQVIQIQEPIEIRTHHQSVIEFNEYYEMHAVAELFNQVYLHPIVIEKKVTDIILIVSEHSYPKNHIEIVQTIINHLNLAIERVRLVESLKESGTKMIRTLTRTIEAKDRYTVGHSERVAEISRYFASKMGYHQDFIEEIYLAGLLHDVGKLVIEDRILTKEGRLIEGEYDRIKEHPIAGSQILKNAAFSKNISDTAKLHHKRFDLKGYPDDIEFMGPMPAIVGVADALDAIMTDRSYSVGRDIDYAIEELERFSGTQFDPDVVAVAVQEMRSNRRYFEELLSDGGQNELPSIIS